MRSNYEKCISASKCVLVPYRPEHVVTYHDWMKDPGLLHVTGSEPLSMEEEVEMQQSWKEDIDKCTFIILAKDLCVEYGEDGGDRPNYILENLNAMIGDVNLFLSDEENDTDLDSDDDLWNKKETGASKELQKKEVIQKHAELDIMIAVKDYQRRGIGQEAAQLMMLYGAENLGIRRFFVKIKEENMASRNMFEQKLGFVQCNYVECFREVELEFRRETAGAIVGHLRQSFSSDLNMSTCSETSSRLKENS
eukprot:CAMPEP_0198288752 /NCGR_PEP_ID=MMETSP1449-20131203/7166_1 /TAXON_ID=420275 /ORGANISM="Attheya septentrionalis, Strain CCMP2084" /LENGTH=250 /DNA_ID=CAMNT_0043986959 /DNA_START=149 /DNA_END=901 /DNA_ORIENTATION=-